MFRLDNILEKWAQMYKPIAHDPNNQKNRRFFRIDIDYGSSEWVNNFNLAPSPAMAYCTQVDGRLEQTGNISYQHRLLFMVKQKIGADLKKTSAKSDLDAADCKFYAQDICLDCIAFLGQLKKEASTNFKSTTNPLLKEFAKITDCEQLKGLDIKSAVWATIPMRYSGWWICELDLTQVVQRPTCIVNEKYNI